MRRLAVCLLLLIALVGCASEATPESMAQQPSATDPPADQTAGPDMTTFTDGGVSFDHPTTWTVKPPQEQILPDRLVEVVGEEVVDGFPPLAGLSVGPAPLDIDALEQSLTTGAFDEGSETVSSTDVEVEGAEAARIVETVYPNIQDLGVDGREQMLIVTLAGDAIILRVAAPQAQWDTDRATFEAIISSLRLA